MSMASAPTAVTAITHPDGTTVRTSAAAACVKTTSAASGALTSQLPLVPVPVKGAPEPEPEPETFGFSREAYELLLECYASAGEAEALHPALASLVRSPCNSPAIR